MLAAAAAIEDSPRVGYIEQTLLPGETVVHRTRLHWTVLLGHVLGALVFAALGVAALIAADTAVEGTRTFLALGGALLLGIAVVFLVAGTVIRNATEMAVTSRRVLIKKGIVRRETLELFISKIESVVVNESFMGRMLGYGTVVVRGTGGTPEVFDRVTKPIEFRRAIQGQIDVVPPRTGTGPAA
jgi:uncharacterized membrane protein YdbT with pleckstrin-like domain